jgi:hypothetical protein
MNFVITFSFQTNHRPLLLLFKDAFVLVYNFREREREGGPGGSATREGDEDIIGGRNHGVGA